MFPSPRPDGWARGQAADSPRPGPRCRHVGPGGPASFLGLGTVTAFWHLLPNQHQGEVASGLRKTRAGPSDGLGFRKECAHVHMHVRICREHVCTHKGVMSIVSICMCVTHV